MADYWKSQGRKFCDFCKCWIADNKPSIDFHEGGKKHKENITKRLKEIQKTSAKQAKQTKKFENDLKKMEDAAMAAYLRDVDNNTRDITARKIIHDKWNKPASSGAADNPNQMPDASPDAHPRFHPRKNANSSLPTEYDPCDPFWNTRPIPVRPRPIGNSNANKGEGKGQGKGKQHKGKGKGSKAHGKESSSAQRSQKIWYEAQGPHGCSYYWNIETNESVWEPPECGYMTLQEQEEEAKEQALQETFLKEIEVEEEEKLTEVREEQRANTEREKLKTYRERSAAVVNTEGNEDSEDASATDNIIPYRRDYSVPEKPQLLGSWQVVKTIERSIDLQLPRQEKIAPPMPNFQETDPPVKRTFHEKTLNDFSTADSDDEASTFVFKKRKFGNKNMRQRSSDV